MSSVITFRAGIATYNEDTKVCEPKPMQGVITIRPSGQDEEGEDAEIGAEDDYGMKFWDFQWKTKDRSVKEDKSLCEPIELILIPGETKWVHVKSCPDARMFALVFSSNEKYFFWLQDKNPDGLKLNELNENDKIIYDKITSLLKLSVEEDDTDALEANKSDEGTPEADNNNDNDDEQNNDIIMADAAA